MNDTTLVQEPPRATNEAIDPPLVTRFPASGSRRFTHFTELDGLRGIAALAVFCHHVCFSTVPPAGWPPFILHLRTLCMPGDAGVDLFFVLSGFLITSLLLDARTRPFYYHDFYWKRALRILPLYMLVLLYVLAVVPGSGGYVLLSALFLSNFALLFHVASAGPFWTLAIEEQFYLLWPTLLRRLSLAQLRRWALALALTCVALRFVAASVGHHTYYYTFFRCDGLAAGACIAFWFYQRSAMAPDRHRENNGLAAILALGVACYTPSLIPSVLKADIALVSALQQTGITLIFTFLIAYAITHAGERKLAILRSPVLTFFGLISYALYMVHLYVVGAYDHLRPLTPGDQPAFFARFAIVLVITIAICLISRYLIELPANSLRRYVLAPNPRRST